MFNMFEGKHRTGLWFLLRLYIGDSCKNRHGWPSVLDTEWKNRWSSQSLLFNGAGAFCLLFLSHSIRQRRMWHYLHPTLAKTWSRDEAMAHVLLHKATYVVTSRTIKRKRKVDSSSPILCVQVSYSATTPALAGSTQFPYSARVLQSSIAKNQAMLQIIQAFEWQRVAILTFNEEFEIEARVWLFDIVFWFYKLALSWNLHVWKLSDYCTSLWIFAVFDVWSCWCWLLCAQTADQMTELLVNNSVTLIESDTYDDRRNRPLSLRVRLLKLRRRFSPCSYEL